MPVTIPHADKRVAIRAELVRRAKARKTITYGELGALVGIPGMGPWKPILDDMGQEETEAERPDITYLVVRRSTGYPGQIDFQPANPPTDAQEAYADQVFLSIFEHYAVPS